MAAVTFPSENAKGDCPGRMYGDPGTNSRGIIVVQEWWGLNDEILCRAKRISEEGDFVTLVPDLYRGIVTDDYEKGAHLMEHMDWESGVKDIQGAVTFLKSSGCTKVGVTGFCMGGALSILSAAMVTGISAAAPFYGTPKPGICDLGSITIPVQAHFGELDPFSGFSSPEDAKALEAKLSGKCDFKLYMYPAGHAFNFSVSPNYNADLDVLSMKRLKDFMTSHLQ